MSEIKVQRVVLQLAGQQYTVDRKLWESQEISASVVGDARVVVRRGAVVANIPSDVPFGTFCVCVNLASINNDGPFPGEKDAKADRKKSSK